MSKGQASEQDLNAGLAAVGSLANLSTVSRPRKDNPFSFGEEAGDVKGRTPITVASQAPPSEPTAKERTPRREATSRTDRSATPSKKAETEFTDDVTVPMTAEMRTKATLFAANLQRRRTTKSERLTANSIFRVAIQVALDAFQDEDVPSVNSEEELLEAARKLLAPRRTG
jgi:hypothetical protein